MLFQNYLSDFCVILINCIIDNFIYLLRCRMRRNQSMQLPKNNSSSIKLSPRIQYSANQRLHFPQVGDSGFYGNVGRKHYEKPTHFIHKLILNPDAVKNHNIFQNNSHLGRNKSVGTLNINRGNIYNHESVNSVIKQTDNNKHTDSLTHLQEEFERKRSLNKQMNMATPPQSESIPRKGKDGNPSLYHSYALHNNSNSHNILFGSFNEKQSIQASPRKFNPTYLSSELGYN